MRQRIKKDPSYYTLEWSPVLDQAIAELKQGNVAFVKPVISFLEQDPYAMGSGYRKEKAWRYLKRVPLTERQKEQLRDVALKYVRTRMCREFLPMCRFVSTIADGKFQEQVYQLMNLSDDKDTKRRAGILAGYFEGVDYGERYRWQSLRSWS